MDDPLAMLVRVLALVDSAGYMTPEDQATFREAKQLVAQLPARGADVLVEWLERQQFNAAEAKDAMDGCYRVGWNAAIAHVLTAIGNGVLR